MTEMLHEFSVWMAQNQLETAFTLGQRHQVDFSYHLKICNYKMSDFCMFY